MHGDYEYLNAFEGEMCVMVNAGIIRTKKVTISTPIFNIKNAATDNSTGT